MSDTTLELPETLDANPAPEDEQHSGERHKSPRELAMEAIYAKANAVRDAELEQSAIYDEDARAAGLNFPPDEQGQPVQQPEPVEQRQDATPAPAAQQDRPVPASPAPAPRLVEFDGHQVTEEQARELMRLGMMANVALHQYQPPQAFAPHITEQPVRQPQPLVDQDRVRQVVKEIQFGGEDAAAAALAGFVQDVVSRVPMAPQIDQNALVQQAVTAAQQAARDASDKQVITQEYADIFENPLRQLSAHAAVSAIRQRNLAIGRQQSDLDVYREAGEEVRKAFGMSRPGNQEQPSTLQAAPSARQDVIERKRAVPRATQAIDMRSPAPATPRAPTGSDVVDQMRRSRGQASMR